MTELQKKLARRRNLNGEIESSASITLINGRMDTVDLLTTTIQHASTNNNSVNSNVASDETNIGFVYNTSFNAIKDTSCVSPNRKQHVVSVKSSSDNSNTSTSSTMSELQAKLSRRRTLNREHDSMNVLTSDATEYINQEDSISAEDITAVIVADDAVNDFNVSVDVIPVEKIDDCNSEEQAEVVVDSDHPVDLFCQYSPIEVDGNNVTKVQEIKLEVLMDCDVSISTVCDGVDLGGGSAHHAVVCNTMVVDGDVHIYHDDNDDNNEDDEEDDEEEINKSNLINNEDKINVTRYDVENDNTIKQDEILRSHVDILDSKLDCADDYTRCIDSSAIIQSIGKYTDDDITSDSTGYVEQICVDRTTTSDIVFDRTTTSDIEIDSDSISEKSKVKGIISIDEYSCTGSKMRSNRHNQFNTKDNNDHKNDNDTNVLFKDGDGDGDDGDNQINHSSQISSDLDGVYQLLIDNQSLKQEIVKLKDYAVENERIKKVSSKITDQLLVEQSKFKDLMVVNESLRNEVSQSLIDSKNSKSEILKLRYLLFENDDLKARVKELSMENEQLKNDLSKTSELSIDNEFLKKEIRILKQELLLLKHLQNEERIHQLERESRDVSSISASSSTAQQPHLEQVPVDARPDRQTTRRFVHSLRYAYHNHDYVGSGNDKDGGGCDYDDDDDDDSSVNMFDKDRNVVDKEQLSSNGSPMRVYRNNGFSYNGDYEKTILNTDGDTSATNIDNKYGDKDGDVEHCGSSSSSSSNELSLDLLLQSVSGITDFDKYNFDKAKNSKINSKWSHKARTLINEKELVKSFLSISLIGNHNSGNSQNDDVNDSKSNYGDTESSSSSSSSSSSKNNMEYTEFLKKFATCDDLVNFTRDFISSVLGPEGDTSKPKHPKKLGYTFYGLHKLDIRCKSFFNQMQDIFIKYHSFQDENEERIICARDCLEQYVLGRIGDYAFQTVLNDVEDRKLLQKMETLSFITYESLDIKASLYNEDMINHAIEELKKINIFKTPGDKVACIVKSATVVFKLLSLHAQQQKRRKQQLKQQQRLDKIESLNGNSDSSINNNNSSNDDNSHKESYDDYPRDLKQKKKDDDAGDDDNTTSNKECEEKDDDIDTGAGADDFLPLFIWVVLRSHVPRLVSNCEYIQTYLNSARLMSQSGYCLINLRSAIEFITNITAELINMDPLIFDMKCKQMER